MDVTVNPTDITMVSRRGTIRIYPIDANIFTTVFDPFWEITTAGTTISTIYPAQYTTETPGSGSGSVTWAAGNEPTIFESMRDLRRRVAVELGFLNTFDEVTTASELIKDGLYWDAYRATNKIELMASEISLDLHGIDIALGEEGKL